MLVLAKKPDEAFKAPLKTKKQAPVTGKTETGSGQILETTSEVLLDGKQQGV